jgi:hypothetical protein
MRDETDPDDLYSDLERRALHELPEDDPDDDPGLDLFRALRPPAPVHDHDHDHESGAGGAAAGAGADPDVTEAAADMTLGGYIELHHRVPAFEGSDGMPYTVDVDVVAAESAPQPFAAFLMFIRWAATGAGIMDHVESGDVAYGDSEESARQAAYDLSLYEVRAELDAAIERRRVNRDSED